MSAHYRSVERLQQKIVKTVITVSIMDSNYLNVRSKMKKNIVTLLTNFLKTNSGCYSLVLGLFFIFSGINSRAQVVGPYTGIDYATNYTNPVQGPACSTIAAINLAIGDADFVNGAAEVPMGWQFSGTWNSGLAYFDGPGMEVLLVSLHTYTERWHVALRLSNGTTTGFQDFDLTIVTSNATGSLAYCGGVANNFDYERPSQELDFATYAIPAGVGVIGIIFEPFDDGAVNPDPHGVMILQGTPSIIPCDTVIITSQSICEGDSVFFQGAYYNTTGNYADTLTNVDGCDSVLSLNLTVHQNYLINQVVTICQGDSILFNGIYYSTPVILTDSLQSGFGCDSIVIVGVAISQHFVLSQNLALCQGDSILLEGVFQTGPGIFTDSLQSIYACDSIVTTTLTFNPTYLINQSQIICQGDSALLGGSYQTTTGVYTDLLQSSLGCDSAIVTSLTVNPSYIINQVQTICQGDSVLLGGSFQTTTGVYTDALQTTLGCDSSIVTSLTVNPTYLTIFNKFICQGDSLLLAGSYQTTTGVYTDALQTNLSCDSIIVTHLTVNPTYVINLNQAICEDDSTFLGGSFQNTAGTYTDALQTNAGCDSIVLTTLSIVQYGDAKISIVNPLCADDSVIVLIAANTGGIWSGAGIVNNTTGEFDPAIAGEGTHEIRYTLGGPCSSFDTLTIVVTAPCNSIEVPNVFTPNGDGSNDFLVFKNLERSPNNHLVIYNRWGQNIFETDSYQNNWNGDGHTEGTYYFILDVNNSAATYKGFFTLYK